MAIFKVRKDYYRAMIDTEFKIHNESFFYHQYLDAKKYGHYFMIEIYDEKLIEYYYRILEYIEFHQNNGFPQLVRTAHRIINEIVSLIGDPREKS